MTGSEPSAGSVVRARTRRLAGLPHEVARLAAEVAKLRQDLAQIRRDLGVDGVAAAARDGGPTAQLPGAGTGAGAPGGEAAGTDPRDSEQLVERMAVLEDGLDEIGDRLEGMARDGITLLTSQLDELVKRVDQLAKRPLLTEEQGEQVLARLADLARSGAGTVDGGASPA